MPTQAIDFSNITNVVFNGADQTEVVIDGTTIWEFPAIAGTLSKTMDNPNAYGDSGDLLGNSVACTDTYSVSGAIYEDSAAGSSTGKAYIFTNSTGALRHTLAGVTHTNTTDRNFGHSVAMTDTYTVVGAPREGAVGNLYAGHVYVYNTSTGSLLRSMAGTSAYGQEGKALACTNNYILAGADDFNNGSGRVQVYNPANGSLLRTLSNPNPYSTVNNDRFGGSVACTDTYAVVGAHDEDSATGGSVGKVYVFNISTGVLLRTISNPNAYSTDSGDEFGDNVACTDMYVVVAAAREDDAGGGDSGKVYIFDITDGSLLHTLDNPNNYNTSSGDKFGWDVACTNACTIVGAKQEDASGVNNGGIAYIFNTKTGALLDTVDNPANASWDSFGSSVAISAGIAAVGASGNNGSSGTVYLFT